MPYWRLLYHVIWGTKNRAPLLTQEIEKNLFGYLRGKAYAINCNIIAINGVEDHIHLAITIPPAIAVARAVGRLKGASAYHLNQNFPLAPYFAWQSSYGVLPLSEKDLVYVVGYIDRQKQHHAANLLEDQFENIHLIDPRPTGP